MITRMAPLALALTLALAPPAASAPAADSYRNRLPEDELIYFLLPDRFANGDPSNDRGGLDGDRLVTGYDPTSPAFYHGGDLKGLTAKLAYIQGLGATAVWVAPVFKNKAVQGSGQWSSAGYHGYWITDFNHVDPHLGTDADFKALVEAAHRRGMKVYMDIVANHTADVIRYRECADGAHCAYRSRGEYPYAREGGATGKAINAGFAGDQLMTAENFAQLTDPNYAYHPYVPAGEERAKSPDWLNDIHLYHNRGSSTFKGESSTMGDFGGLDDLMTENPRVLSGMIDIYGGWIDRFGIDGFRIDTAQHVNPEFWQGFVPAILARAKAAGIPNFHIFGEVATEGDAAADAAKLAQHTRVDGLPAVLDFSFRDAAMATVAGGGGTDTFARMYFNDPLYANGFATANELPTFVSNHDAGRFAAEVRKGFPLASDDEVMKRVILGHAMLLTLRGVPTIYAGDEQGFVGHGPDQQAREDQFASRTPDYLNDHLLGTRTGHEVAHWDMTHPIYRAIAELAAIRLSTPALRRGRQIIRTTGEKPGLLAVSRFDPSSGHEVLIAFNTGFTPISDEVEVESASLYWKPVSGSCPTTSTAPRSVHLSVPALSFVICAAM